jgi:hypothetical protein
MPIWWNWFTVDEASGQEIMNSDLNLFFFPTIRWFLLTVWVLDAHIDVVWITQHLPEIA